MFQMIVILTFYLFCVACTEVILHDCYVVLLLILKKTSLEKMVEKEKRVGIKLIEGLGLV